MLERRDPTGEDVGFVVDSWRQSYVFAGAVRGMDRDEYFTEMGRAINALLARPDVELRVVVDTDKPAGSDVVGWAAFEGATLHYVYVRKGYRGQGVARMLLDGLMIDRFSHRTPQVRSRGWLFSPFRGVA